MKASELLARLIDIVIPLEIVATPLKEKIATHSSHDPLVVLATSGSVEEWVCQFATEGLFIHTTHDGVHTGYGVVTEYNYETAVPCIILTDYKEGEK